MITKRLSSIRERLEKIPDLDLGQMAIFIRKTNPVFEGYKERLIDLKINPVAQEKCIYMITDTEFGKTEIMLIGEKHRCKQMWDNYLEINQDVLKDIVTEIIRDNEAIFNQEITLINPVSGTTMKTFIAVKDKVLYLCPQLFNIENLAKNKYYS